MMDNNYAATLESLLEIKNEKKKKEFSKTERDQFCSAWVNLASAEGYSKSVEKYLYDGSSYCGGKPLKEFMDQAEHKEEILTSFFSGRMYGDDSVATFRLLTHLFALLLNDMNTNTLVSEIIVRFPRACINKEKKRLGKINQIMMKYFFAELDSNTQFPHLSEMGINPGVMAEFIEIMDSVLNSIDTNNLSKNKTVNMKSVQDWLEEYRKSQSKSFGAPIETYEDENIELEEGTPKLQPTSIPDAKLLKSEMTSGIDSEPVDLVTHFTDLLNQVQKAASAIKGESAQYKNKIENLTRSLEREQEKLNVANKKITDQQEFILSLQQKLSEVESEIISLKKTVSQKDILIEEKDVEIYERTKMIDVLGRERHKQADEVLQRIASKIRVEYRDFKDAVDVPMSCDLGENFRLQLQNVFDILEKSGMKIQ